MPAGVSSIVQNSGVWGLVEDQGDCSLVRSHGSEGSEAGASAPVPQRCPQPSQLSMTAGMGACGGL